MRIKLDENVPDDVIEPLKNLGHDVDTVKEEGLSGEADPGVWAAAQKDHRFLVTQDHYFADIRHHPPGTHEGVLLLRLPQTGRLQAMKRVREIFEGNDVTQWVGCNVVANENHVRVRRPESPESSPKQGDRKR
jgi:predicted nuclease of predicted toxin-antitoxin system